MAQQEQRTVRIDISDPKDVQVSPEKITALDKRGETYEFCPTKRYFRIKFIDDEKGMLTIDDVRQPATDCDGGAYDLRSQLQMTLDNADAWDDLITQLRSHGYQKEST